MLDAVTDQLHLLDTLGAVCLTRLQARNASGRHDYTVTDAEFTCWFAPPALPSASALPPAPPPPPRPGRYSGPPAR